MKKYADGEPCCKYIHIENYTTEITHEIKNHPVMCGNVSIRHRIFYVSGFDS